MTWHAPSARRPLTGRAWAIALLSAATFFGMLVVTATGVLSLLDPGPFPAQYPFSHYLAAGSLWGVCTGLGGAALGLRRFRRQPEALVPILLGIDLTLLLVEFWPIAAAATAVGIAVRAGRRRGRPWLGTLGAVGALGAGALVLVLGGRWGLAAHDQQQLRAAAPVTTAGLTGTWHQAGGPAVLDLRADGSFTLRRATWALDSALPADSVLDEAGSWARPAADGQSVVLTPDRGKPADLPGTIGFDVRLLGRTQVLCLQTDPDAGPCPDGFHR